MWKMKNINIIIYVFSNTILWVYKDSESIYYNYVHLVHKKITYEGI